MTRPLDPATLRAVARELAQSAATLVKMAKRYGRQGYYYGADTSIERARECRNWAVHFDGQAKTAERWATRAERRRGRR